MEHCGADLKPFPDAHAPQTAPSVSTATPVSTWKQSASAAMESGAKCTVSVQQRPCATSALWRFGYAGLDTRN